MPTDHELWLRFLWSFALSDHLGDAADALREYAEKAGRPMPADDAELDVAEDDQTAENSWLGWVKAQGVKVGIYED